MAKILLITNYYYPKKSVATNRMLAYAKYLTKHGHNVYVLTDGNGGRLRIDDIDVYYVANKSYIKKLDVTVKESRFRHYVKCAYNILLSYFNVDSGRWKHDAIEEARVIINEKNIDFIIASYPTIEPLQIAHALKKEFPNLKYIADMRDALWAPTMPKLFVNRNVRLGTKALKTSNIVIAACKPNLDRYKELVGVDSGVIYREIRNGFDFNLSEPIHSENEFCNIVYSGSFYGDIKPNNFFKAVSNIIDDRKIRITIIGNKAPILIPEKLSNYVEQIEWMEYSELINYLKSHADLLLMIIPKSREKGVFSGKIFDYIACLKPVLGLVPTDDIAAELLTEVNACYLAENEKIDEIQLRIVEAYRDWENKKNYEFNKTIIMRHHREAQVSILDSIIKESTL